MAISVADNFSYQGTKPLDARVSFDTVAAMAAASDATLYDGCFSYVKENKKYYSYDSTNEVDPTTSKWREFSGGGTPTTTGVKFAFHYSETDSNPDSVTYPAGYDNSDWGSSPAYMDFTNDTWEWGAWDPEGVNADKLSWLIPKPCMLKSDGTVDYYLDPNDYTKKADGTASDVADTRYDGNAMIEWGQNGKKIYWKLVPDNSGDGFTFCVADYEVDEDYHCWNHYDCDDLLKDHFYTAIYEGSVYSNKLRSLSGKSFTHNKTFEDWTSAAIKNNATSKNYWYIGVYADHILTIMLTVLITKSLNSQAKIGKGRTCDSASSVSYINTGTMNTKGLFWGGTDLQGVKIWGMENIYGNDQEYIHGYCVLIGSSGKTMTVKTKLTYGIVDGSTSNSYNTSGNGYLELVNNVERFKYGFTSHLLVTPYGFVPITSNGSDSTYYTDRSNSTSAQSTCCILVGGRFFDGSSAGIFKIETDLPGQSQSICNIARLSCK